ncbi:signal peptide peptidase SppA [Mariniluteicoccus flavus]
MDPISLVRTALCSPKADPDGPVVLELDLARGVVTAPPSSPLEAFRQRQSPSMREVRDALRRAKDDDDVAGLVLHLGECPLTPTQGDEVAEAVRDLATRKPVIAWTESFGELTSGLLPYRIATAASEIWLQPSGALGLAGVHLETMLLRGGLEKLDIEPEFSQRKEYKTAADQFAAREVTEPHREMLRRIGESMVDDTVARIAATRRLDEAVVREAIDASPLTAAEALERGLVDKLGYRDEVYAELRRRYGKDDKVALRYAHRYHRPSRLEGLEPLLNKNKPAIGVVSVSGAIVAGPGRPGSPMGGPQAGADTVGAHLREAARDDAVKAVVLRVDSPGGSYIASDAMRREVLKLRETGKPVVAAMGQYAASGGYFAAMGCDEIVANPTTLTGSIGVLAGKFVTQRLVERLGLVREAIDVGRNAGMMGSVEGFTPEQWEKLDAWLDEVYADFTTKAAHDRGMDLDRLEPLARGRVWTGADAHARGLVDHLGGMGTALDRAAALACKPLDKMALRPIPAMPWMEGLRSANSSEDTGGGPGIATPAGFGGGPEALLAVAAHLAGISVPAGVLSLPWQVKIS